MRWTPVAGLLLAAALSGCIGSPSSDVFHVGQDCSRDQQVVTTASADVLLPAALPTEVRESMGPRAFVTVTAREGQTLQAVAAWVPVAGQAEVQFDGPARNAVATDHSWSSSDVVPAGDYTLEIVGSPMAYDVTFTLYLVASGCTPIGA